MPSDRRRLIFAASAGSWTLWRYATEDDAAAVRSPSYFDNCAGLLERGDHIAVGAAGNGEHFTLAVLSDRGVTPVEVRLLSTVSGRGRDKPTNREKSP